MLKKILPVGCGLVLILLIAVTVSVVKKATNKTPAISNANTVYVSYGDLNVTNDRLYTTMKNKYGVTELLNMVDEQLFKDEVAKVDVTNEDYLKYVNNQIFSADSFDDVKDEKTATKSWTDVINSLRLTGLLTRAEANAADVKDLNCKAWTVVKDYYKLSYARNEWAKKAYLEKYFADREDGKWFDETNAENSTSSIEKYYQNNYKGSVVAFFVPFTSAASALAMMEKYGINTNSSVLTEKGWVSSAYDYNAKENVEEEDFLTYDQVFEAFVKMYNEVYAYQNNGNDVIKTTDYEKVLNQAITANIVKSAIADALGKTYGASVVLPTTVQVGEETAKVTWSFAESNYGAFDAATSTLSGKFDSDNDVELKVTYVVEFKDATSNGSVEVTLDKDKETSTVTIDPQDPFYTYAFTSEFLAAQKDSKFNKFEWTSAEAEEVNSTLANYFCVDGKLTIAENAKDLYKSYTLEAVKIGNYYYLMIKLSETKAPELFEKNADDKNKKDDEGNYIVANKELYDEIVEKMKEELLTDNNINRMIYELRQKHNVKIFDAYIEAIYEYEYTQFFETTLKLNDYTKYKTTKKNQKSTIVSYQTEAGNKKSVVKYTANDLYGRLEPKYASSVAATMIENYNLIVNQDFNNIFNPYNGKVYDKTSYKALLNSEINTLRKNFESGYFTYSYLSYYGFTPNFPAKYGWSKFIKDYFTAYNDEELLTTSAYGGTIYTDALAAYTDSLYGYEEILAEMEKALAKDYSVATINLIVSVDWDYNANDSDSDGASKLLLEKDNWTEEQKTLAVELCKLMYEVANQTNGASLSDQMTALVALYKEAEYTYNAEAWNENRELNTSIYEYNYFGKYKLAGLNVKFETAATYTGASSIYEEYADVCRDLFKKASELDLLDTTFDVPMLCSEPFTTDYGYHMIAITTASTLKGLPTEEEVMIYRAQALVDAAKEAVDAAKKNIDTYKASGYNIKGYEAALDLANAKLEKYTAELETVLAKYGHEKDYTLDEDASARIKAYYTAAESAIEGGTLLTKAYVKEMNTQLANYKFVNEDAKAKFADFLVLLAEECERQDA